jgi:hypothetical protein
MYDAVPNFRIAWLQRQGMSKYKSLPFTVLILLSSIHIQIFPSLKKKKLRAWLMSPFPLFAALHLPKTKIRS